MSKNRIYAWQLRQTQPLCEHPYFPRKTKVEKDCGANPNLGRNYTGSGPKVVCLLSIVRSISPPVAFVTCLKRKKSETRAHRISNKIHPLSKKHRQKYGLNLIVFPVKRYNFVRFFANLGSVLGNICPMRSSSPSRNPPFIRKEGRSPVFRFGPR